MKPRKKMKLCRAEVGNSVDKLAWSQSWGLINGQSEKWLWRRVYMEIRRPIINQVRHPIKNQIAETTLRQ